MPRPPSAPPLPASAQTVTASNLVRHFGTWQRRAAIAPVYILHHRKPQFVLASVEVMQAAIAGSGAGSGPGPRGSDEVDRLFRALPDPVLIVDRTGRILQASHSVRTCLGDRALPGASLIDLLDPDSGPRLVEAVIRVAGGGIGEYVPVRQYAPQPISIDFAVEPHPAGALLSGRPAALAAERDQAQAAARAVAAAWALQAGAATARIEPPGRLIEPDASLVRTTGRSRKALAGADLPDLFAPADRAALIAAMATGFAGRDDAGPVHAGLILPGGRIAPASVTFAPLRPGIGVPALAVAILMQRG